MSYVRTLWGSKLELLGCNRWPVPIWTRHNELLISHYVGRMQLPYRDEPLVGDNRFCIYSHTLMYTHTQKFNKIFACIQLYTIHLFLCTYTSWEWYIYGAPQIISSFPHKARSLQHLCLPALALSLSVCSYSCAGPLFRTFSINKQSNPKWQSPDPKNPNIQTPDQKSLRIASDSLRFVNLNEQHWPGTRSKVILVLAHVRWANAVF